MHCVPGGDKPLRMCASCTPHVQKAGRRGRQVAKQDLLGAKEFQLTQAGRETVLFSVGLIVLDNGCCLMIIHCTTVLSPTRRSLVNWIVIWGQPAPITPVLVEHPWPGEPTSPVDTRVPMSHGQTLIRLDLDRQTGFSSQSSPNGI